MTEVEKLQLTLDEPNARVLLAALIFLPLLMANEKILSKFLKALKSPEEKALATLVSGMLAGARHATPDGRIRDGEMSEKALKANMERAHTITMRLHGWVLDAERDNALGN